MYYFFSRPILLVFRIIRRSNSRKSKREREREKRVIDVNSARVGAVLLFFFYLFSLSFFYCNFWQFTTFIIITFIIYNYTLDSVVYVYVFFFHSHSISHPTESFSSMYDDGFIINEELCWYWWRKRRKKCGIKQQKKTHCMCERLCISPIN